VEGFADETNCNLCGHCIAVCPENAVLHQKLSQDEFTKIDEESGQIDADAFIEFLKARRSHRNFLPRKVPDDIFARLFEAARQAPTGSNTQDVQVLVIRDRDKIEKLVDLTMRYYRQLIVRVEKKVEKLTKAGKPIPPDLQWAKRRNPRYMQSIQIRESGKDSIFRGAQTVLVFHSRPQSSTPKDNCVIAAHTVVLTAMTLGIGSCYMGLFEDTCNHDPRVVKELHLPEGNRVYSALALGYPKYVFLRTVYRKPLAIQWA
jgi:nitroreductase